MVFEYSAIRKISYQSWFLVYLQLFHAHLLQHPRLLQVWKMIIQITIHQSSQVKLWIDKHGQTISLLRHQKSFYMNQPKSQNQIKMRITNRYLGNHCSDIPDWLQEFRENLVDERVLDQIDSHVSSSHEPSVEFMRSVDLGKHSVYTHFQKDRNCEICQRTKITRVPCRRRVGRVERRAENFGDLITADHKIVSEACESRNNQRYAVVVQDLATQWIQSYPCKTKTSQETERSLQKFLEPNRKPKVIYTDNSLESVQLVLIGCLTELIWTPRSKSN